MIKKLLQRVLVWLLDNSSQSLKYHPLVWINGKPEIGEGTYIGGFSEIYAKGAKVYIGKHCDIASFVVINCADSSFHAVGKKAEIERLDITICDNVFIGTQSAILGGCYIGENSIIGAGVILKNQFIAPYSLVRKSATGELTISPLN